MFFVYLWISWMVGCGMMDLAILIWQRHKKRSQRIKELEAENRHQRMLLEFYENIAECDNVSNVSSGVRVHHDTIKRTRVG